MDDDLSTLSTLTELSRRADRALGDADAATFAARLQRWGADLLDGLRVYPSPGLAARVVDQMARALASRRPVLRTLDETRLLRPDWFAGPEQVGYVCYPGRFAKTLRGVGERIGYLRELGVTYLHLMPLLDPRDGPDDGGYAVRDYRRVREDLGTTEDLAALADTLHENGIALTVDLVLNHVAREHAWARAALRGEERYRGYFHVFADRQMPDAYEETLPEVFPAFAPGSFSWVPEMDAGRGAWVWTTFNDYQWDLDWSNPEVFLEMLDVVLFLANLGVDCLRLDAVAFLWKRMGTDCQNQPEVHSIVQALRAAVRIVAPATVFKAEAIVSPEDLPAYLGTGRHAGKVCDLAYHNSLMVQLWSCLATGDARLARHALAIPPPKPVTAAWGTYVRCHDDIGWAISDADAAAAGLTGAAHRQFLANFYAGRYPGSFARGLDFQANPETGDVRTCGTLASLAGLEAALEAGDTEAVDLSLGRIFLVHAVIYGFGGIPLLYMGDELGLRNDESYRAEADLAADSRWTHRPPMPWDAAGRRTDPGTVEGRIFAGLVHLARLRARMPSLHAAVESHPVDVGNPAVLALYRRHAAGSMLQLYNVSPVWQRVPTQVVQLLTRGPGPVWEHLSDVGPVADDHGDPSPAFPLPPYAAWWLAGRAAARRAAAAHPPPAP
jgi:amylosucrase